MINIERAIKDVIEREILRQKPLLLPVTKGASEIEVASVANLQSGKQIAIYDDSETCNNFEINAVSCVTNAGVITLQNPIANDYQNGKLQPIFDNQFVKHVLIGNPPEIPTYPAITVEETTSNNTPFTLGSFSAEHHLQVTVWADATTYEESYSLRSTLATRIENSLFRTVFPLIEPYCETTLTEPFLIDSNSLKVANGRVVEQERNTPIYVSYMGERYSFAISEYLGNGVATTELVNRYRTFPIGTTIILPIVTCYDALPTGIEYGGGRGTGTLLLAARINYSLKIAQRRAFNPSF